MKKTQVTAIAFVATVLTVLGGISFAQQDKYTLKVPGGLAFSEFRGYEDWPVVATSQSANLKLVAVILANPEMIEAYKAGIPGNGKPFPDGAKMAKIHWTPKMNQYFPDTTVPGALHDVDFMVKDSKSSPTAADGDGPCSNMTPRPVRSCPAPRPTSRRRRTTPNVGIRVTRSCRQRILFSRSTENGEDVMSMLAMSDLSAEIGQRLNAAVASLISDC